MVRSCKWVDEVVVGTPYVVRDAYLAALVKQYRIDYIVHGDDPCVDLMGRDVYDSAKRQGDAPFMV